MFIFEDETGNSPLERFSTIRSGFYVERMHTVFHHRHYDNGNHSANAALLAAKFSEDYNYNSPPPSLTCSTLKVMTFMLLHDLPEASTGDIPSPTKKALGHTASTQLELLETQYYDLVGLKLPVLTYIESEICKLADMLELLHFSYEEWAMGNLNVSVVIKNLYNYLNETFGKLVGENLLADHIPYAEKYFDEIISKCQGAL